MDPAERLAAFLADELSADERTALQAELARDAGLRAQLEAMRRADTALTGVAASELPDGARERLIAALAEELDAQLGAATDAAEDGDASADVVDLAARRVRRGRWMPGLAAAAAALVAVVGGVQLIGPGGADEDAATVFDAAPEAADADEDDAADLLGEATTDGPVLVASGRALDEADAAALLDLPEVLALSVRDLDAADAEELAGAYAFSLGVEARGASGGAADADTAAAPEQAADDGEAVDDGMAETESLREADGRLRSGLRIEPGAEEVDLDEVGACLDELLRTGDPAIAAYAELVSFEGEDAIAFVLVTAGTDQAFERREVWVLARDGCDVRFFGQA